MRGKNIVLSLVGMSGSGKSVWSQALASAGFVRFCCDEMIAEKLGCRPKGREGTIETLGEWMGFPSDPGYQEREEKYLSLEIEVLSGIIARLKELRSGGGGVRVVVDTTGSVIYAGGGVLSELKALTTVVYLALTPEARQPMLEKYIAAPRPVLWQGLFVQMPGETRRDALIRCYPLLLDYRERFYRSLCDVEIPYEVHRRAGLDIEEFLGEVASRLQQR
jgi:hypothetical protein